MGQIIQTIRRLSSDQGLEFNNIDLVSVVRGLVPLAKIICKGVNLSVETEHARDDLLVSADRTALEQVIINLVANSCEALAEVERHGKENLQVVVSVASSDTHAIIKVRDNGCGGGRHPG